MPSILPRKFAPLLAIIVLCFGNASTFAADPVCSGAATDTDGDGWGWENNASCIVETGNPSTYNANACSSPAADNDGDGWGWENNSSCVVVASTDTGTTGSSPTNSSQQSDVPVCSSAQADSDNDGWGWEYGASCIVVARNGANQTTITGTPLCSSNSFDPDGDGYGWENNRTCVAQTPTATTQVNASIRIMALGDSITHGYTVGNATSYRKPFVNLLNSSSCQFEMVGSRRGNYRHNTFVSPHEGYNGFTADEILNQFTGPGGANPGISVTVNRYQPDVVLMHLGTNDMRKGQNIAETVSEIDQIIAILLAADSSPTVLLANLIPWYGNIGPNVATLGDQIGAYVSQLGNSRVRLVDVRSGYQQRMMLADGVHPNPSGENHIANRFFQNYTDAGFCQ